MSKGRGMCNIAVFICYRVHYETVYIRGQDEITRDDSMMSREGEDGKCIRML